MITTIADQYLAQNAGRRYPFADDTADIPGFADSAVLDFRVTVPMRAGDSGTPSATLTGVSFTSNTLAITVSAGFPRNAASLTFTHAVPGGWEGPLTLYSSSSRASGAITVTESILAAAGAQCTRRFADTTVAVEALGVNSITCGGVTVSGDVELDMGYNADPYLDGNRIRLDIYKGAGIGEYCQAVGRGVTCDDVLLSINGERPGSDGDIRITGYSGVTVTPKPAEHAVEISLDGTANAVVTECKRSC